MALIRFIRRRIVRNRPFPESWLDILHRKVPYYHFLPADLKNELQKHLPVIADEKHFEGCGGLIMTDEKKVIISAYAAILILGDPFGYYPTLQAILVYPGDYVAPVHEEDDAGIMTEGMESRSGESWNLGSIVLSWRDIERDIHQPVNGRNLIFHEFAHQLDDRYGISAGIDETGTVHTSNDWNEILATAFRSLRQAAVRHEPTLLDTYGATNPAEFFSVATETFFEKGPLLKRQQPDLYRMLKDFYRLDPAGFLPGGKG